MSIGAFKIKPRGFYPHLRVTSPDGTPVEVYADAACTQPIVGLSPHYDDLGHLIDNGNVRGWQQMQPTSATLYVAANGFYLITLAGCGNGRPTVSGNGPFAGVVQVNRADDFYNPNEHLNASITSGDNRIYAAMVPVSFYLDANPVLIWDARDLPPEAWDVAGLRGTT